MTKDFDTIRGNFRAKICKGVTTKPATAVKEILKKGGYSEVSVFEEELGHKQYISLIINASMDFSPAGESSIHTLEFILTEDLQDAGLLWTSLEKIKNKGCIFCFDRETPKRRTIMERTKTDSKRNKNIGVIIEPSGYIEVTMRQVYQANFCSNCGRRLGNSNIIDLEEIRR